MLILFWLMVTITVSVWPIGYIIARHTPHLSGRTSVKVHHVAPTFNGRVGPFLPVLPVFALAPWERELLSS